MHPSYQLTKHPVGSKREFWTMTWPLMVGLISTTLMVFVDRLFLAWYDPLALNGAANGGMAYFIFLVLPMSIASIAEVLVGRLHGEGRFKEIGTATWQMIWFALCMAPLFWCIAFIGPQFLFMGTGNEVYETSFFKILMLFAPFQCAMIAFSGFFIGLGEVRRVTYAALIGNGVNIVLDYFLIFGFGPIPELGVEGAAYGTGIAQAVQTLYLLYFFLHKKNRETYGTDQLVFNRDFFWQGVSIGAPSGSGHFIEVIAHFIFFRIILSVGADQMAIVAMVQSLYILFSFVIDAGSKGASAIVSNLLGARVIQPIQKVLISSFTLHTLYFLPLFLAVWFFPSLFFNIFASVEHQNMLADPYFAETFAGALIALSFFFLFDGYSWILVGFLTASGDTRYVFLISVVVNWLAYVLPTLIFVGYGGGGADTAWAIVATMAALTSVCYLARYLSGAWLKRFSPTPA